MMRYIFLCSCIWIASLTALERGSSAPYISGDTFRAFSNYHFDELARDVLPEAMIAGDSVFVKSDMLGEYFEKIHPRIQVPYVLISHNSDAAIPGAFAKFLEDPTLYAWFGQNVEDYAHPKLHPIPIGIANLCWAHGNINIIKKKQSNPGPLPRESLLYMNFTESTYPTERSQVARLFKHKEFCIKAPMEAYGAYLNDLRCSIFVLSPRGNGIDCHRTWESILMGAIPIVRTSALDSMYDGLPVLIVQRWEEINRKFLLEAYPKVQARATHPERALCAYWLDRIADAQWEASKISLK